MSERGRKEKRKEGRKKGRKRDLENEVPILISFEAMDEEDNKEGVGREI